MKTGLLDYEEFILKTTTGKVKYVAILAATTKNIHKEVNGVQGIIYDLTEKKESENELKKSFSLLHSTLDSTADGIYVVDRDGMITSYNRKFVEMWFLTDPTLTSKDDNIIRDSMASQLKEPEPPKGMKDAMDKIPVFKNVLNMAPKLA